jgi:hypothetical protein
VGPTRFYKQPQEAIASLQGRVICPTVISLDDGTYDGPLDISGFSSSNGLYTHRRENTTQPTEFTLKIQGDTRILAGFNFVQGLPNWYDIINIAHFTTSWLFYAITMKNKKKWFISPFGEQ